MRLAVATVFAFFLAACQTTTGFDSRSANLRTAKTALVIGSIMADGVMVYGNLPPCPAPGPCRKAKNWSDVKLIAGSVSAGLHPLHVSVAADRPSLLLTAALVYSVTSAQYQIAKTVADTSGPTVPGTPPDPAAVDYLVAAGLADLLISDADERVREAIQGEATRDEVLLLIEDLEDKLAVIAAAP